MLLVGCHHYEYLDLPKTFLPYFDSAASRSSRSHNVPEPTTVHSKTNSHQPQSSPAPHQLANLPVIQVTQDLLDKVHLLIEDTAIKSLRGIIHDQLSSQHDSLTYWASHIQVTQAENVFTLFDQNMTSQRLAACLSVPCPDRGTGHWLSVDLLNVSIGMFLQGAQSIAIDISHEHTPIQHKVTLAFGQIAIILSCDIGTKLAESAVQA